MVFLPYAWLFAERRDGRPGAAYVVGYLNLDDARPKQLTVTSRPCGPN